jgi:hypothetical protein
LGLKVEPTPMMKLRELERKLQASPLNSNPDEQRAKLLPYYSPKPVSLLDAQKMLHERKRSL